MPSGRRVRRRRRDVRALVFVGGEGGDRWTGGLGRQVRAMAVSPFVKQRLGTPWFIAGEHTEDLDVLRQLLETGQLAPVISSAIGLHDVPDALRDLVGGRVQGKVVITP